MITFLQQLHLFQLSSTTFPVGGFVYSQGLEWAIEAGWIRNIDQFYQWQINQIKYSMINQDLPLFIRLYYSALHQDLNAFDYWSQYLFSCRETNELRSEEQQRGQAMFRILQQLDLPLPSNAWYVALQRSYHACLAWWGAQWKIPIESLMLSVVWSNIENGVMAGIKLVPFGQFTAQSLLLKLSQFIALRIADTMDVVDDDLGGNLPIIAIASACHETQHTRLFKS